MKYLRHIKTKEIVAVTAEGDLIPDSEHEVVEGEPAKDAIRAGSEGSRERRRKKKQERIEELEKKSLRPLREMRLGGNGDSHKILAEIDGEIARIRKEISDLNI